MRFKSALARVSNARIVRSSSTSPVGGVVCSVVGGTGGFGSSAGLGGSGAGVSGLAASGFGGSARDGSRDVVGGRVRCGVLRAGSGTSGTGGGGSLSLTSTSRGGGGGTSSG